MPGDDDLIYAATAAGHAAAAVTAVLSDTISILVSHLGLDRQHLAEEISQLYAPVDETEIYQAIYNGARNRVVQAIQKKP